MPLFAALITMARASAEARINLGLGRDPEID
mgnify:CR=1 FL=1